MYDRLGLLNAERNMPSLSQYTRKAPGIALAGILAASDSVFSIGEKELLERLLDQLAEHPSSYVSKELESLRTIFPGLGTYDLVQKLADLIKHELSISSSAESPRLKITLIAKELGRLLDEEEFLFWIAVAWWVSHGDSTDSSFSQKADEIEEKAILETIVAYYGDPSLDPKSTLAMAKSLAEKLLV